MRKLILTVLLSLFIINSVVLSFGFGDFKKTLKKDKNNEVSWSKYDKTLVNVEAIKKIQEYNNKMFSSAEKLQNILIAKSEQTQQSATYMKMSEKEIKTLEEDFDNSYDDLVELSDGIENNETIMSIDIDDKTEKKEEKISQQELLQSDTEYRISEKTVEEYDEKLKELLKLSNKGLLYNLKAFLLGKDLAEKLQELSGTVKNDAVKNPVKGVKYVKSIIDSVKVVSTFIGDSSKITSNYYKIIKLSKYKKPVELEKFGEDEGIVED